MSKSQETTYILLYFESLLNEKGEIFVFHDQWTGINVQEYVRDNWISVVYILILLSAYVTYGVRHDFFPSGACLLDVRTTECVRILRDLVKLQFSTKNDF